MNPGAVGSARQRGLSEYRRRAEARRAEEAQETEEWTRELEDDGAAEILLLYELDGRAASRARA